MTKDRVGAGLAVLAAIIGLVLVFQFPQSEPGGGDDDGPETSEVAPAAPGQPAPAPGQVQQPAPGGQVEQPAPQQQEQPGDTGGDDDDDDG
ncbi:hypothetical protein PHK61_07885 [Actinomycetospora lutea]|uniref:hypothetical protein n=1 Tax=Actinomycetospora lutea TaxID=663604 RepID=UPI002366EF56|nr:hypothetical protein [Actinomycetospora lutea]MDD7938336.1 hypothetical protein [Actinomycetospora lutea]